MSGESVTGHFRVHVVKRLRDTQFVGSSGVAVVKDRDTEAVAATRYRTEPQYPFVVMQFHAETNIPAITQPAARSRSRFE
jgi:hypothetical protein